MASPILLRSLRVIGATVAPRSCAAVAAKVSWSRADDEIVISSVAPLSYSSKDICTDEHVRAVHYLHSIPCLSINLRRYLLLTAQIVQATKRCYSSVMVP